MYLTRTAGIETIAFNTHLAPQIMYLTRTAGIETVRGNVSIGLITTRMYLTRTAGIETVNDC